MKIIGMKNHLFAQHTWGNDLEQFQSLMEQKKMRYTKHSQESLQERNVSVKEIETLSDIQVIQKHDIGTFPFAWNRLNEDELTVFFAKTKEGKAIHLVVALKKRLMVTVYYPSPLFFEADQKTLKAKFAFKPIYE